MSDDQPKPIPRKSPSDKKRSGPSMREQIAARRKAETEAPTPAPKKAKAGPKAAAKAAPKAASKPAAKPAAEGRSRTSSRSSAGRAGGARSRGRDADGGDDAEAAPRGRRARPEKKKKSPIPLIAAGVLVVGGGIGVWASGMLNGGSAEASETPDPATDTVTGAGETPGDVDPAGGGDPAAEGSTDGTEDPSAAGEGDGGTEAAENNTAKVAKPEPGDVKTEDLYAEKNALEPFGKPDELSEEEWAVFVEKAALVFEDGGGPSSRAERSLAESGKYAWPALLNEIIKIDPADSVMNPVAERATLVMNTVRGSTSRYGFDYATASKSKTGEMREFEVRKNLRLIIALHESWAKVVADPKHWEKIDVSEQADEAAKAAAEKVDDEFGADEFGDVEVPEID